MSAARFSAAQAGEANAALALILGWHGGWMPVYQQREGRSVLNWSRVGVHGAGPRLARHVRALDEQWSYEIAFGLPRRERRGSVARSTILWARVEGADQLARARRLRPLPTLVLQEGSSTRRLLLWALTAPAAYLDVIEANRKLAYAVGAVQKHGDPDVLRVPAPGTFLRVGRARPVPVVVSRMEPVWFSMPDVVGRLREPPPKDAWLTRQQAGR